MGRSGARWAKSNRLALDATRLDASGKPLDGPPEAPAEGEWAPWAHFKAELRHLLGTAWRHIQVPVVSALGLALLASLGWAFLWVLWPLVWAVAGAAAFASWQLIPRGPERTVGVPLLASGALGVSATWAWGLPNPVLAMWALLAILWCGLWLAYGPLLREAAPVAGPAPDPLALATPAGPEPAPGADSAQVSMPSVTLLAAPQGRTQVQENEVKAGAAAIEAKLDVFDIQAKVVGVDQGPAVVRYVVELPAQVPVAKVERLHKDLALALAAESLRIEAPIPGRSAIGIEVPSKHREKVPLRAVMEAVLEAKRLAPEEWMLALALGWGVSGQAVMADLARCPHLLVAGASGKGKSVCLNCLISSLLLQHGPDTLKLLLVDVKRVELRQYGALPHLAAPVIEDPQQATAALSAVVAEMEARYKLLRDAKARDIAAYNARQAGRGEAPMPYLVVVVDELGDLVLVSRAEARAEQRAGSMVEDCIVRIGQLGRAAGVHLVLATQRPSADVITGLIKANVTTRIALTVASQVDSRVILDAGGAEKLLGAGDMLYRPDGGSLVRLQGAFMTDAEVDAVVRHWTQQGAPSYLELAGIAGAAEAAAPTLTFDALMRALLAMAGEEGAKAEELIAAASSDRLPERERRSRASVYNWLKENAADAGHGRWRERPA
jgi:DNA segregation ATPase FtsK/SpoIIIE-like protein